MRRPEPLRREDHERDQHHELDRKRREEERPRDPAVVRDPLELTGGEQGFRRTGPGVRHLGLPQQHGHSDPSGGERHRSKHLGYRHASVRAAVVSDIHANLHALEGVLAAVESEAPDEVWFLGDLLGYGPRPNR